MSPQSGQHGWGSAAMGRAQLVSVGCMHIPRGAFGLGIGSMDPAGTFSVMGVELGHPDPPRRCLIPSQTARSAPTMESAFQDRQRGPGGPLQVGTELALSTSVPFQECASASPDSEGGTVTPC